MSIARKIGTELVVGLVLASLVAGCGHPRKKSRAQWEGVGDISEVGAMDGGLAYDPGVVEPLPDRPPEGEYELVPDLFENVHYDFDSAVVRTDQMYKLDAVAGYLAETPNESLLVEGHCDERGSREYNMALGERRAQAARDYLIDSGIDSSRLQTMSYGEEMPADPGHDESAWQLNRRAEFKVMR